MNTDKLFLRLVMPLKLFLLFFGVYLLYQILRKIFGGSWDAQDVVLGILFFNVSLSVTMIALLTKFHSDLDHLRSNHDHLQAQFSNLATDVKTHLLKK